MEQSTSNQVESLINLLKNIQERLYAIKNNKNGSKPKRPAIEINEPLYSSGVP